jgi:proteasome lid subunit RPN8/RPN11
MILANTEELINHILKERVDAPNLIVIVHTHPAEIAHPSEADKAYQGQATELIRNYVPDATVVFGIHSVSSEGEGIRQREEPKKSSKNRITWSSITRSHELAFYDTNLRPVEVGIGA